jgi:hypothetical protein
LKHFKKPNGLTGWGPGLAAEPSFEMHASDFMHLALCANSPAAVIHTGVIYAQCVLQLGQHPPDCLPVGLPTNQQVPLSNFSQIDVCVESPACHLQIMSNNDESRHSRPRLQLGISPACGTHSQRRCSAVAWAKGGQVNQFTVLRLTTSPPECATHSPRPGRATETRSTVPGGTT